MNWALPSALAVTAALLLPLHLPTRSDVVFDSTVRGYEGQEIRAGVADAFKFGHLAGSHPRVTVGICPGKADGPDAWFMPGTWSICVSDVTPAPRSSVIHELGHYLDYSRFGYAGFSVATPAEKAARAQFAAAALATPEGRSWETCAADKAYKLSKFCRTYMLTSTEVWARAYAQSVATWAGDTAALGELHRVDQDYEQWAPADLPAVAVNTVLNSGKG